MAKACFNSDQDYVNTAAKVPHCKPVTQGKQAVPDRRDRIKHVPRGHVPGALVKVRNPRWHPYRE